MCTSTPCNKLWTQNLPVDSISDKISDHIEELQETKWQVSQLPLQIKTIIQNELKNIQNSCGKRPCPLDLESINSTLTPKRKAIPCTPSFNYFESRNRVALPVPMIKMTEKIKLIKEKETNLNDYQDSNIVERLTEKTRRKLQIFSNSQDMLRISFHNRI